MLMFFATLLWISIVGMASMLVVKRYELNTRRLVFVRVRPAAQAVLERAVVLVCQLLPRFVANSTGNFAQRIARFAHRVVAHAIVMVEYWLQRTLDLLHVATHAPAPTMPASAFLREVAEHKENLLMPERHAAREPVVVRE